MSASVICQPLSYDECTIANQCITGVSTKYTLDSDSNNPIASNNCWQLQSGKVKVKKGFTGFLFKGDVSRLPKRSIDDDNVVSVMAYTEPPNIPYNCDIEIEDGVEMEGLYSSSCQMTIGAATFLSDEFKIEGGEICVSGLTVKNAALNLGPIFGTFDFSPESTINSLKSSGTIYVNASSIKQVTQGGGYGMVIAKSITNLQLSGGTTNITAETIEQAVIGGGSNTIKANNIQKIDVGGGNNKIGTVVPLNYSSPTLETSTLTSNPYQTTGLFPVYCTHSNPNGADSNVNNSNINIISMVSTLLSVT
eukprot:Pgem_evm1s19262